MFATHLNLAIKIGYIALTTGTVIALFHAVRRYGWKGVPLVSATLLSGLYGARVWGATVYGHAPLRGEVWWRAAKPGFYAYYHHASIVGGILGGLFAVHVSATLLRLPWIAALGALTPGVAAAQAVGRLQCYVMGCCFGRPTTLPWGVAFPADTYAGLLSGPLPLHPTQLYESILDVALFLVVLRLVAQSKERRAAAAYLAGYGAIRMLVECFRVGRDAHFFWLSTAQWVALALFVFGVATWLRLPKEAEPELGPVHQFG